MDNEASTWKNQIIKVFERTKSAMAEYFVNWNYVSLIRNNALKIYKFCQGNFNYFSEKDKNLGGGGLKGSELLRLQTGYVI